MMHVQFSTDTKHGKRGEIREVEDALGNGWVIHGVAQRVPAPPAPPVADVVAVSGVSVLHADIEPAENDGPAAKRPRKKKEI